MSTLTSPAPMRGRSSNNDIRGVIAAAGRQDLKVRRTKRWPVFVLNGVERPELRPLLVKLIVDRVLEVVDPSADLSLIVPAGGAR